MHARSSILDTYACLLFKARLSNYCPRELIFHKYAHKITNDGRHFWRQNLTVLQILEQIILILNQYLHE